MFSNINEVQVANPYIAYSALLMAGIDGIENKIDPTLEGYGPYDVNVFDLPEESEIKSKYYQDL